MRDSTRSESGPSRWKRRRRGSRCVGARARAAGREFRARHPGQRAHLRLHQAGRPESPRRDPRPARGDARRQLSAQRPRVPRLAARHAAPEATRRASGSPTTSISTRTTRRSATRNVVAARVSLPSDRSFTTFDSAAAHAAVRPDRHDHDSDLEAGDARRRARLPHRVRQLALLDRPGLGAARRPHDDRAAVPAGRRRRARLRIPRRPRPRSTSIRAGARRRSAS